MLTPEGQLDRLEAALQDEGRLALRSLRFALNAVRQDDREAADRVIAFDDEVDDVYREIDAGVRAVLGYHPTTVKRVRLALCILRASVHLERIADYSVTIAKLATQRAAFEVMDSCLQLAGLAGYCAEDGIERAVRDARLGPIGGGTDEIMKEVLGRSLGL